MNDLSSRFRPGDSTRQPTRRAQAKLATRERVLSAAKRLFVARGYESATIRDIAQEAGMSTGAVFANFADKKELFHEVLRTDLAAQSKLMGDAADHPGPVQAALSDLLRTGYEHQLKQLPLLQAATVASWAQGLDGAFGERPQRERVVSLIADILHKAVLRGELTQDAPLGLLSEMLWDAYAANYRRAVFDRWTLPRLVERADEQIAVILAGALKH